MAGEVCLADFACEIRLAKGLRRRGEELLSGAMLDQFAQPHEEHVVGDAPGLVDVVGDHNDGVVCFDVADQAFDAASGDRVERGCGFIAEQHFGLNGKRTCQTEPLLLPDRRPEAGALSRSLTSSRPTDSS